MGLSSSPDIEVGFLNLGPGTSNEAERQAAADEPLPIPEESRWHLRGTKAEHVIQQATDGARDYLRRESEAWQALPVALEEACGLQEREAAIEQDPRPHLLPALKRRIHRAFFDTAFRAQPPPPSWLEWDLAPSDPRVLRLQEEAVGIGSTEELQRIKEGVAAFLVDDFREYQRRFFEVDRLRHDMMLMQGIVHKTLAEITEVEIHLGICPACPYPEAVLDANTGPSSSKSRVKEESEQ